MNYHIFALLIALLFVHPTFSQTQHNANSSLGINLAGHASWETGYAFVDAFKASRPWISQMPDSTFGNGGPLDLDSLGWVRSLDTTAGQWAETLVLDGDPNRPVGQYVLLYEGEGTLDIFGTISSWTEVSPGRIHVDVTTGVGGIWFRITETDPNGTGNYLRNFRFILPGYELSLIHI